MSTVDAPAAERTARLPRWLKRLLAFLAILGPGLIAANAGNDAGGILTYASAGAQFGYRTLFLMVLITVALIVVQEMCSRLGAYTGEGLGALIREHFPLRSGASAMVLLFVANAGLTVSEFAGVSAAMEIVRCVALHRRARRARGHVGSSQCWATTRARSASFS